jgi:hypothetical protein
MNNHLYRTLVVFGDGVYADIATCYLAHQLRSVGVKVCRVRGLSSLADQAVIKEFIDVDHSIHLLNEELAIPFAELMSSGTFIPKLITSCSFLEKSSYFESYNSLKDDLPVPLYQVMARLIREGVATEWESVSPLIALHKAGKFHPELHQFYRGNVRPYGGSINVQKYSEIINAKSLALGVDFLNASKFEVDVNFNEQYISVLHLSSGETLQDVFFIDMTRERCLIDFIDRQNVANTEQNALGYSSQPWVGNCLAIGEAAMRFSLKPEPVNSFEWLFKALVRFVDFFPSPARQNVLAAEYNRLQKNDFVALADFVQTYHSLSSGNSRALLPEKLRHRVNLFAESCQLSEEAADWAYASYWPTLMRAGGISPQSLPRRVQEIPLQYLVNWYNQRLQNINHLVGRAHTL